MKTLKLILLLTLVCAITHAQPSFKHPNAVYLTVQPVDLGMGLRTDIYGLYVSASYGNYWLGGHNYIKDHVKFTTGVLIPLKDYNIAKYDLTVGVNYHDWGEVKTDGLDMNPIIFRHISFELGLAVKFKHLAVAVATDILRWEPELCIGIPIKTIR